MKKDFIYPLIVGILLLFVDKILPSTINNTTMIPAITLHDIIPVLGYAAIMGYYLTALKKRDNRHKLIVRYYKNKPSSDQADIFSTLYSDQELKTLGFKENEIDIIRTTGPGLHIAEIVRRYSRLME